MALIALALNGHPDQQMPFVGVTGTNGKTTLTYLLESVCQLAGWKPAVTGTVSYRFNGTEVPAARTTPEAPEILARAAEARRQGCRAMLMEVSSHALSFRRVYGFQFQSVIFTNLTRDHLDYYSDMDEYGDAKRRLFDGRNGPLPRQGIFNLDDPFGATLYRDFQGERAGTGRQAGADCRICRFDFQPPGLNLLLDWQGQPIRLSSPLTGAGNMHNLTQAFACAAMLGIDPALIKRGLEAVRNVPGRMDEVPAAYGFRVFVDYAHSEDALANACTILRSLAGGRLITVFGCGGDKDRGKRPRMGKVVAAHSDIVVVTSDNPRSEDPERIIDMIVPGILEIRSDYHRVADRREAIRLALGLARPGDVVLLAGKGHETVQVVGQSILPFHDKEVAVEILAEMKQEQG